MIRGVCPGGPGASLLPTRRLLRPGTEARATAPLMSFNMETWSISGKPSFTRNTLSFSFGNILLPLSLFALLVSFGCLLFSTWKYVTVFMLCVASYFTVPVSRSMPIYHGNPVHFNPVIMVNVNVSKIISIFNVNHLKIYFIKCFPVILTNITKTNEKI